MNQAMGDPFMWEHGYEVSPVDFPPGYYLTLREASDYGCGELDPDLGE